VDFPTAVCKTVGVKEVGWMPREVQFLVCPPEHRNGIKIKQKGG